MSAEPSETVPAQALRARLDEAMVVLGSSLGSDSPLHSRMSALRDRLETKRLQIAVLGQFKRGKSTFINALLGAPLLPTGVLPLTAIPTFIAWGTSPAVRIQFEDGRPSEAFTPADADALRENLARFVTEDENPKNHLGVGRVDLLFPAMMLRDGSVLIDTPGIGSTLAHNTDAALAVIPECDASFFVISTDPPITEVELSYLKRLSPKVGRIFFVLNKIDYVEADERVRVVEFLRSVLVREGLIEPEALIFAVSAKLGLAAKLSTSRETLERSGITQVEDYLKRYLATEKITTLINALRRKAADLLSRAISEIALRTRALQMPLEQLVQRSSEFSISLRAIEAQRLTIDDLLSGDRRRLIDDLETLTRDLRRDAGIKLTQILDEALSTESSSKVETIDSLTSTAIEQFFTEASTRYLPLFFRKTDDIFRIHQKRVAGLIDEVRHTAGEMFDATFAPEGNEESFRLAQEPYWVTERIASTVIPDVGGVVDLFLPTGVRRRRARARRIVHLDELIVRNAENLRWAILRGIDEAFRRAVSQFTGQLEDAMAATRDVVESALERRRDRSFQSEAELGRLARSETELKAALDGLVAQTGPGDCFRSIRRLDYRRAVSSHSPALRLKP